MTIIFKRCKIPSDTCCLVFYYGVGKNAQRKSKSFDEQKGWGFITVPHEGEIFVHYSGIEGTRRRILHPDEEVSLVIVQGQKGPQAAHVRVLR